ncbi:hypothetical protein V8C40DRAFT_134164 [Trichoderma camerunense]
MGGRLRCALGDDGWLFFVLEDMSALVLLRGYSTSPFCFSLSIYFEFLRGKSVFYLLQKGMMGILGPGGIMGLDSRSSVLSCFILCGILSRI